MLIMNLNTPISQLSRVGKTTAKRLERLGVATAADLLFYFPFRYEDFRSVVKIADLKHGEAVTVRAKVELIANKRSPRQRKNITEALVSDASGSLRVVWFNQPFIGKTLRPGDEVFLSGKARTDMLGAQMIGPVYERVNTPPSVPPPETSSGQALKGEGLYTTHTARLVPMYPLTAGLTQKQIRFLVSQVIVLSAAMQEWLPDEILDKYDLAPLSSALQGIHFPKDEIDLAKSTERLKFDELFLIQLKAELSRLEKADAKAPSLAFNENAIKEFVASLPFTLTKTQKISAWEILQDLQKTTPMNRLLSGDVGSGKTVVAAMAMYNAALNGYQAVLMAPTEILAVQHYNSIVNLLGHKVKVGLLTGSKSQFPISNFQSMTNDQFSKFNKKDFLEKIKSNNIQIIIGTHALLTEGVEFERLGLVIVDEQHRFGVGQRKTIKEKGGGAHFLSMTATPIPRSLALMVYGDLDVSIINELPPGRKKILTRLVEPVNRVKAYTFIREQVKKGRQCFVVCPLIGANNEEFPISNFQFPKDDKKSVLSEFEKLSKNIFPDLRVGYLHGRLKPKEKDGTMEKFRKRELDILVSTSVVEVGVDIPNTSVMMIEGAERFGLAQLHQFRGRVGRSVHQSYCFLFVEQESPRALERLRFFEKNNDGFKLAEKDLEMRGPGEVYGTAQSGFMNLRLAKLTDKEIIKKAREAARQVAPRLGKFPTLTAKIKEWENAVHLE
ncbi:ATP-dependent DNA helicase RecG [Patescibacteria group bacterium]|nr:MAG: ATP-dependent DNA helicase RecG [Patescibacteria group bacterium]